MNKLKELKELLKLYEENSDGIGFIEAEHNYCLEKYVEDSGFKFYINIPKMRTENTLREQDLLSIVQRNFPLPDSIGFNFCMALNPEEMAQVQDVLLHILKRKRAKMIQQFTQDFKIEIK